MKKTNLVENILYLSIFLENIEKEVNKENINKLLKGIDFKIEEEVIELFLEKLEGKSINEWMNSLEVKEDVKVEVKEEKKVEVKEEKKNEEDLSLGLDLLFG